MACLLRDREKPIKFVTLNNRCQCQRITIVLECQISFDKLQTFRTLNHEVFSITQGAIWVLLAATNKQTFKRLGFFFEKQNRLCQHGYLVWENKSS